MILNFVAAFMIAPELIGLDRLKRFQERAEESLRIARAKMLKQVSSVPGVNSSGALFLFGCGCLGLCVIYWRSLHYFFTKRDLFGLSICALMIPLALYFYLATKRGLRKIQNRSMLDALLVGMGIFAFPSVVGILFLPYFAVVYFVPRMLANVSGLLLDRIRGNERLRTTLVTLGISFFIIGNILQFISTFLPSDD